MGKPQSIWTQTLPRNYHRFAEEVLSCLDIIAGSSRREPSLACGRGCLIGALQHAEHGTDREQGQSARAGGHARDDLEGEEQLVVVRQHGDQTDLCQVRGTPESRTCGVGCRTRASEHDMTGSASARAHLHR